MKLPVVILVVSILFLSSCASFNFPDLGGKPSDKPTIGGKGVQLTFVGGNPPLDAIRGDFGLALKLKNYNFNELTIDRLTLTSTWSNKGFSTIADGPITLEAATLTDRGKHYPGDVINYYGAGDRITDFRTQDVIIFYGDNFRFQDVKSGDSTAFYADMDIYDYVSTTPFQICVHGNCPGTQTITGSNKLGPSTAQDPVAVNTIKKTATPGKDTTVTLAIQITDSSKNTRLEQGNVIPDNFGEETIEFELQSVDGPSFNCEETTVTSDYYGGTGYLTLTLHKGKAHVTCTTRVAPQDTRQDYLYQINLRYPYHQRISTPSITVIPTHTL